MGERKRGNKYKYNINNFKINNKFGKIKANPRHTHNNVPPWLVLHYIFSIIQDNAFKTGLNLYEQGSLRFSVSALKKAES